MTAAPMYASQAVAFFAGAALVLLVLLLVLGSMATMEKGAVISRFEVDPGPGPRALSWEVEGALVVLLHRTGEAFPLEVPAKGTHIVNGGQWTLMAVSSSGARAYRKLTVVRTGAKDQGGLRRMGTLGAAFVLGLMGLASGCSGNVQQLRQPVIQRFAPDQVRITPTQGTVLRWTVEGASQLTLEPGGDVTGTAFRAIHPEASQSYVLTARSLDGLVDRARVDVEVVPVFAPPPLPAKEGDTP